MASEALNITERTLDIKLKEVCILLAILIERCGPFIQRKPYRVLVPKKGRQKSTCNHCLREKKKHRRNN